MPKGNSEGDMDVEKLDEQMLDEAVDAKTDVRLNTPDKNPADEIDDPLVLEDELNHRRVKQIPEAKNAPMLCLIVWKQNP